MKPYYAFLAIFLLAAAPQVSDAGGPCGSHGCCEVRCPKCQHCVPEVEVVKIMKPCFEVEWVPVCIPRVTFPWELKKCCKPGCGGCGICCPPAKCAKVRMVHVLRLDEYECQECKYKWTPVCRDCYPPCGPAAPPIGVPGPELPLPPEPTPSIDPPPVPLPPSSARNQKRPFVFQLWR